MGKKKKIYIHHVEKEGEMISGLFCCDCRANMIRKNVAARCCLSSCGRGKSGAPFCKACFARRAGIADCTTFLNTFEEEELKEHVETEDRVYLQAIRFNGEIGLFCNECVDGVFSKMLARHLDVCIPKNSCLETLMRDRQLGLTYARAAFENAERSAPSFVGCKVPL